ncbi:MAG: hypothetical protein JWN06_2985 [Propionibacteriaceae bacterium]|jgi:hypothetical protein|nr:hypothetical protein [Propionibacteriaceae bacterium]
MHVAKANHDPGSQVSLNLSNDVVVHPTVIKGYLRHGYRFVDLFDRSGPRFGSWPLREGRSTTWRIMSARLACRDVPLNA